MWFGMNPFSCENYHPPQGCHLAGALTGGLEHKMPLMGTPREPYHIPESGTRLPAAWM